MTSACSGGETRTGPRHVRPPSLERLHTVACGPSVSVAGKFLPQQATIGPVSSSSRPALLTANVFLSSRIVACSSAVSYLLIGMRSPQVRSRRTSPRDGVRQRWKLMPQPAPPSKTGESRTMRYALPSSSKSTHGSEVM